MVKSSKSLVGLIRSGDSNQRQQVGHPAIGPPIRDKVLKHLNSQRWAHTALLNVTVNGGVIDLWGLAVQGRATRDPRCRRKYTGGAGCKRPPDRQEPYSSKMTWRRELPETMKTASMFPRCGTGRAAV